MVVVGVVGLGSVVVAVVVFAIVALVVVVGLSVVVLVIPIAMIVFFVGKLNTEPEIVALAQAHCQCRGNLAARQENAEMQAPGSRRCRSTSSPTSWKAAWPTGLTGWQPRCGTQLFLGWHDVRFPALSAQVEWAEPCVHGYTVVHNVGIHFGSRQGREQIY